MEFFHVIPVEITAQTKILVSQISIHDEIAKNSSRFGITYACDFNEADITIGLANPFKFKHVDEAKVSIPYARVEKIKLSVVRLPVVSPLQHGNPFALDIVIIT